MTDLRITRLAPSPTGALHLGNARTFLINWALANQRGWKVLMRIEDLDTPRVKAGAKEQAVEDLNWLGMDWDGEPTDQMSDLSPYQAALDSLHAKGLIYPCTCSRKQIESAQSAPHADDLELRYPGTCRPTETAGLGAEPIPVGTDDTNIPHESPVARFVKQQHDAAWRVKIPDEEITFEDRVAGPQSISVQQQVGDFVVSTKAGLPAYQLAVVVDDARQGVTDIVRGDDLINSAARQLWLYRMLDLSPKPTYWQLPLVIGQDGRRLAKRHGDSQLAWYREQSVPAERIIGLLASWCGITTKPTTMSAQAFVSAFDLAQLPSEPAVFGNGDHEWLLNG